MVYPPVTQFETRALRLAELQPLRVVVGEDSAIARLLADAGFDVVAEAGDGADLVRIPPDVDAIRAVRAALPGTGLVVLADRCEARAARELLADGSEGIG